MSSPVGVGLNLYAVALGNVSTADVLVRLVERAQKRQN